VGGARRFLLGGGLALALVARAAHGQPPDIEQLMRTQLGFTPAEVEQARAGEILVRSLATASPPELAVAGVVRIADDRERLVRWVRDVEDFRKQAELGLSRKLSSPPTLDDFRDLTLDAKELDALRQCGPKSCALRVGPRGLERFRAEVDWSAPDAAARASLLARQLLLAWSQAYLQGGEDALGAGYDASRPRDVTTDFRALLQSATRLHALASPLAVYLRDFPKAALPGVEQFLYWAKGGVGPEPSITLHHLVIHRGPGGSVYVADKQLYASRYADAGLLVLWLAAPRDGRGYYLLAGLRSRSRELTGFAARMLRSQVEEESRAYTRIYLDWIRKSLARTP
jgi:hypothetical protein